MKEKIDSPTDFIIKAMDKMDDVEMILIVRRHKTEGISFDTNTHSSTDAYALGSAAANFSLAQMIRSEFD